MTVSSPTIDQQCSVDIGDGFIMRWSTKADTENIARLVGEAFRWFPFGDPLPEDTIPPPNQYFMAGARRMLSGNSVVMSENDYALVEDTQRKAGKNPIIACVALHRHPAYYGSLKATFGKPELIASDPEYRNKGFIRRLLIEMIHPLSDQNGDLLQFIGGIGHFYRQFGYDYGLYLPFPAKIETTNLVPSLGKEKVEPFLLRRATLEDVPLLLKLGTREKRHAHTVVGTDYDEAFWKYHVHTIHKDKQHRFDADRDIRIIVDSNTKKEVGFTMVWHGFIGSEFQVMALEEDARYVDVKDSVLRQIVSQTKEYQEVATAARKKHLQQTNDSGSSEAADTENDSKMDEDKPEPLVLGVGLHERHPMCVLLGSKIKSSPKDVPGYRFYARIPSYPKFIQTVAPELEKRLADSALAGVSGRLRLNFYRKVEGSTSKGLEIVLNNGKIVDVEDWAVLSPEQHFEEKKEWKKQGISPTLYLAAFAPLTFTSLLTGKQSLTELLWAEGENVVKDESTRLLLNTLFPKVDQELDTYIW